MTYKNGQPIRNHYAGEPPTPAADPADVGAKKIMHGMAADFVQRAEVAQNEALKWLSEAAALLDTADTIYDGDSGMDSAYARAQCANMSDALEALNMDNLADEVRTCRR